MKTKHWIPLIAPLIAVGGFAALFGLSAVSDNDLNPQHVANVAEHVPSTAPAEPKQDRKVLIFSKTNGFRHSSIEIGAHALALMGEKTGAYSSVHTEDESWFEPEKLAEFDAVIFLNTTGNVFRPKDWPEDAAEREAAQQREEELKASLVEYVKGGGGLVGIHSATDTYHGWEEYLDMMGGRFAGHPWHEKVRLRNLEPDHPVNKPLGGEDFEVTDEIYQFTEDTADRAERRMLLALSGEIEDLGKGRYGADGFYPISWVRSYGDGRNFYSSLGHREEIFWNPVVMGHYLAGIQYAMGDLDAEDEPIADITAN